MTMTRTVLAFRPSGAGRPTAGWRLGGLGRFGRLGFVGSVLVLVLVGLTSPCCAASQGLDGGLGLEARWGSCDRHALVTSLRLYCLAEIT